VIYFLIASLGGILCSVIAVSRRRSGIGWFVIGFLIPIIGLILILVLPQPTSLDDAIVMMPEPGPFQIQQQRLAAQRAKQDQSLDALSRLAELKDRGALTPAEFEEKKSELLANI
jgi:Short C-terminal domain